MTDSAGEEVPDSINQLVLAGEFGFLAVDGPFGVEKEGTVWTIHVPTDGINPPTESSLVGGDGKAAVLIADCEAVGGGLVAQTIRSDEKKVIHVLVDQYAMGDADAE